MEENLPSFTIVHRTKNWKGRKNRKAFKIWSKTSFCKSKEMPLFRSLKDFLIFLLTPIPIIPLTRDLLPSSYPWVRIWPGKDFLFRKSQFSCLEKRPGKTPAQFLVWSEYLSTHLLASPEYLVLGSKSGPDTKRRVPGCAGPSFPSFPQSAGT